MIHTSYDIVVAMNKVSRYMFKKDGLRKINIESQMLEKK